MSVIRDNQDYINGFAAECYASGLTEKQACELLALAQQREIEALQAQEEDK
ncbi:MAG: hypothetical protein RR382_00960 [Tannerellaceae bacterium]